VWCCSDTRELRELAIEEDADGITDTHVIEVGREFSNVAMGGFSK